MEQVRKKRWQFITFTIGVAVCLIGAFLMFEGNIFGEETTGIACILGLVGICLTGNSNAVSQLQRIKRRQG
jgi:hypothetical protein